MEGAITTADSKSDGRLKVDVATKQKKKQALKGVLGKFNGRGGPGLSRFKPVGYGKMSFPKAKAITSVVGSSKKKKTSSSSSLIKSLLKGSKASSGYKSLKVSTFKGPKMSRLKKIRLSKVKGLVKAIHPNR